MRRRANVPDLFKWREINDLETRRREIAAQIKRAKPKSHRRIQLEERLNQITQEALRRGEMR